MIPKGIFRKSLLKAKATDSMSQKCAAERRGVLGLVVHYKGVMH